MADPEDYPEEISVMAAVLDAPGLGKYLAFIDREGKIRNHEEATVFLLNIRRYTTWPIALGYQMGGSGLWAQAGDPPYLRILGETPPALVILKPLLLKRSTPPDS